jgi:SAM-dependent methyltransferase
MLAPSAGADMRPSQVGLLACPQCAAALRTEPSDLDPSGHIQSGQLRCSGCGREFPIIDSIPRFVSSENYARGFGFQWNRHAQTQLDSYTGARISERRLFDTTRWPGRLEGKRVLEVGSGAGRFTEVLAKTGAELASVDYSAAVEANFGNNGRFENVLILQGDIYHLPFPPRSFDYVLCIGVLQHTPDPAGAFRCLVQQVKPGGSIAIDVYRKRNALATLTMTHRWVRPLTRRVQPDRLYRMTHGYVRALWPLARLIRRIPVVGHKLNWMLGIGDYGSALALPDNILREWAVLDTFDMLSSAYEFRQTIDTVRSWFVSAGIADAEVVYGHNGIVARGTV